MLVLAVVAVFQTTVIFLIITEHRDAAHIIDISGLQRARSQVLAYLALSSASGTPEAGARAQSERIIATMLATRAEVMRNRRFVTGTVERDGSTPLSRQSDAYFALIRHIEADPNDRAALRSLRSARPAMLGAYDDAVKKRVAIAGSDYHNLMGALLFGLSLQIFTIGGVWFVIVAPSDRRSLRLLADVREARKELEATFEGNPDGIAVYDRTGRLLRVNASRSHLVGRSPREIVGAHITEVVDPRFAAFSLEAFERAMAGETVRFDSALIAEDGSLVDIAVAIFPRSIDNEVVGVNVVSKDMRALRAAEIATAEQTQRLADLYAIASSYGRTSEELLTSAIDLVTRRLGYDFGVVTEIDDDDIVTIVASSGEPEGLAVGTRRPRRDSLAQFALAADDVYEERDCRTTSYAAFASLHGWSSVSGMKIFVGGTLYGTVGFASDRMREKALSAADIGFMRLCCALLGTIIERGRQIRRLDAMAFSDTLTALPNRARFTKTLDEAVTTNAGFALHFVDLDHFKAVNDGFGHASGDAVLRVAADRLVHAVRPTDLVVRLGGDEFAIVQMDARTESCARGVAERVVATLSVPIEVDGVFHTVGASVGVALHPKDGADARQLSAAADGALYRAKRAGRGRFAFAKPVDRSVVALRA